MAERLTGIIRQFAARFTDHRSPDRIEHTVDELIAQRVYALALGSEDLNDHDDLRSDPLLATDDGSVAPAGEKISTCFIEGRSKVRTEKTLFQVADCITPNLWISKANGCPICRTRAGRSA